MTDNVKPLFGGTPVADAERECILTVQQKFEVARSKGITPTGIVFVVFGTDAEGRLHAKGHWNLTQIDGPAPFAVAYAADRLKQEVFE